MNTKSICANILKSIPTNHIQGYAIMLGIYQKSATRDSLINTIVTYLLIRNRERLLYKNELAEKIREKLKLIELEDRQACYSHKGPKSISNVVTLMQRLGFGAEGAVYLGDLYINTILFFVALKFTRTSKLQINQLSKSKIHWSDIHHTPHLKEILNGLLINEILKIKATPTLVWFYWWYICDKCTETLKVTKLKTKIKKEKINSPCLISVWEKETEDLRNIERRLDFEGWKLLLFQVIWSLFCLDKYWGLDHADTAFRNIFYTVIKPKGYSIYETENDLPFYVPQHKYTFFVGDYGFGKSDRYHGTKQGNLSIRGPIVMRSPRQNTSNLPHSQDTKNARYWNPKSLYMFLSEAKHLSPTKVKNEFILPMLKIVRDPKKLGEIRNSPIYSHDHMNYEMILMKFFKDWLSKPNFEKLKIVAHYKMINFRENPDILYERVAKNMLNF